jgi:hypothetical protein
MIKVGSVQRMWCGIGILSNLRSAMQAAHAITVSPYGGSIIRSVATINVSKQSVVFGSVHLTHRSALQRRPND